MTTSAYQIDGSFIAEIEEGQRLRGWITNSYAQIEFMLGDLILRCGEIDEYSGLPKTLPHRAPERVKRVVKILETPGPLGIFEKELRQILDRFKQGYETRNLLAHGFCEYLYTKGGDTGLQFQKWHRHPDRQDARQIRCFRLADLKTEMEAFVLLSNDGMKLFRRIHGHMGWMARPDR